MDLNSGFWQVGLSAESDTIFQLIVPANKRGELIKYLHDIPSSGHLGAEKTLERAKNAFYWPAMKKYIEKYLSPSPL